MIPAYAAVKRINLRLGKSPKMIELNRRIDNLKRERPFMTFKHFPICFCEILHSNSM